jgi:hypothetical protein
MRAGGDIEYRNTTSEQASSQQTCGLAHLGAYSYVAIYTTASAKLRVYRYADNDLASGGSLMTVSGGTLGDNGASAARMVCDGTNLYFNNTGGATNATDNVWHKYSVSGTTLTYVSSITCGATPADFQTSCGMDSSGNFYGLDASGTMRRFNSSGTLQATGTVDTQNTCFLTTWEGKVYLQILDTAFGVIITNTMLPLQP